MGCVIQADIREPISSKTAILKTNISKLRFSCEITRQRIAKQLKDLQQFLLKEFHKPSKTRSMQLEKSMIQGNLIHYSKIESKSICSIVYLTLQNHLKIAHEHQNYLEDKQKLVFINQSLNYLLYCSTFLGDDDLAIFARNFKSNYPTFHFPTDQTIKDEFLRQFKLTQKVSFQRQKDYIFQLCLSNQISADKINQIGHNYKYSATSCK